MLNKSTFKEFLTLRKIKLNTLDKTIAHIKTNRKKYKRLVVILAIFLFKISKIAYAAGIDATGSLLLGKIQSLAFWVVLIKGSIDMLQKLVAGDFEGAKKTFIQYLLIYGFLLAFPWSLRQIKSTFGNM